MLALWIVQIIFLLCAGLSYSLDQPVISLLFFVLAAIGFIAKRWSKLSAKDLTIRSSSIKPNVFPGEETTLKFDVSNMKKIPVSWVTLNIPLNKYEEKYISPIEGPYITRVMSRNEAFLYSKIEEADSNIITSQIAEINIRSLSIMEKTSLEIKWKAKQRGIFPLANIKAKTGDPFGISVEEKYLESSSLKSFVIYPKVISVNVENFAKDMWEGDDDIKGVIEDPTLIRSTRAYQSGDSQKKINWRILARTNELTVNQYEVIRPKSFHVIFDGESFLEKEELEKALSFLASLLLGLDEIGLQLSFSFPETKRLKAVNIYPSSENIYQALYRMAEYEKTGNINDDKIIDFQCKSKFTAIDLEECLLKSDRVILLSKDTLPKLLKMGGVK